MAHEFKIKNGLKLDGNITDIDGNNASSPANIKLAVDHKDSTSNPHSVTKAQVGLTNVDDKSEATIITDVKADSDIADALTKKHSQNTDTGTDSSTFQLDNDASGIKIKNNEGVLEIRNSADNAYGDLNVNQRIAFKTDFDSIFIGNNAGNLSENGGNNVCIGKGNGGALNNGNHNVLVGSVSGISITNGSDNIFIGYDTGAYLDVGSRNILIGTLAGTAPATTDFHDNILIGYYCGNGISASNRLYIENSSSETPLIYGEFDNDFVRINGDLEITGDLTILGSVIGISADDIATDESAVTVQDALDAKQDTLVSGTNIKTINSTSLLGSGDIVVGGASLDGNGNIAGLKQHRTLIISNPADFYTNVDTKICLIPKVDAALTVTRIIVTCDANPTTEITGDLKYADTYIGLANPVVINDFDTTDGVRDDDSISSGAVAAGKSIYISFDTTPDIALKTITIDVFFDYDAA